MAINVKFLTGAKNEIDYQMNLGTIDKGDMIITSDTDELVFINPQAEKKVLQTKTQTSHMLKGVSLGSLEDGSVIEAGTSLDDFLTMIGEKSIPAEYIEPELELLIPEDQETEFEVGTLIDISLQSIFSQNDAGEISTHNILKNDKVIFEGVDASIDTTFHNIVVEEGITSLVSEVSYLGGPIKNDNLGKPSDENAIAAGTILSDEFNLIGHRAYFYGAGIGDVPELNSTNIRLLEKGLNPQEGTEFEFKVMPGQQYIIFAYPSLLKDVTEIKYVEGNDTQMASNFIQNLVEVEGENGYEAEEYKVYIFDMLIPSPAQMTFKVTI